MRGMFQGARVFNQDISNWDVSNVTETSWMLALTPQFNQSLCVWGDKLDPSTNVEVMFYTVNGPCESRSVTANPPGPFCAICI